jgi:Putative motility protein
MRESFMSSRQKQQKPPPAATRFADRSPVVNRSGIDPADRGSKRKLTRPWEVLTGTGRGIMDVSSLAAAFVGMQAGRLQTEVATRMLKMSNDSQKAALQLLDAGQSNASQAANAAMGLGQNLDITV